MTSQETRLKRVVLVRIDQGEDILRSLERATLREKIASGAILSGVGSVSTYRYHVVGEVAGPSNDVFNEGSESNDVDSINGLIIDGRVHAHIMFSNVERAFGGHLEEGCAVFTFVAVVIAECEHICISDWDGIGKLYQ